MAKSNLRYLVCLNADVTKSNDGQAVTCTVLSSEEAALDYAVKGTATSGGYKTTIALATKTVGPKAPEMVTTDIASLLMVDHDEREQLQKLEDEKNAQAVKQEAELRKALDEYDRMSRRGCYQDVTLERAARRAAIEKRMWPLTTRM